MYSLTGIPSGAPALIENGSVWGYRFNVEPNMVASWKVYRLWVTEARILIQWCQLAFCTKLKKQSYLKLQRCGRVPHHPIWFCKASSVNGLSPHRRDAGCFQILFLLPEYCKGKVSVQMQYILCTTVIYRWTIRWILECSTGVSFCEKLNQMDILSWKVENYLAKLQKEPTHHLLTEVEE